ncbi:MAG TPA: CU044_5270 family protein [Thermomonospora sp.]|nr:CU044_5270 family protein [Thermomonospora sp.]
MNDIQEVRRMLAPANPVPPGGLAGSAQDAAGRAAFARVTASRPAPPRRRTRARLVAVGGLAVAVAAGVTVAQNTDDPGRPAVQQLSGAQVVLVKAADAVRTRGFTAPRPDQWVYVETRYRRSGVPRKGEVRTPASPLTTVVDRLWTKADGTRLAYAEKGRLVVSPTGSAMPPSDYATVARLPRDPDALLAWARRNAPPKAGDDRAFGLLSSLLNNNGVLPPDQEAAVYRAMAKIPRVVLDRAARDGRGRPALGVSLVVEGYVKQEILLDPATYAYRGHRATIVRDHTFPDGGTFRKGTVESESMRLAAGVVDRAGQRP